MSTARRRSSRKPARRDLRDFAIDAAGAWTYTASSAHDEFADGVVYTDTFTVAASDGTTTSVTINITGTNDAAILSADVRNLTETNSATDIGASGTLTISDVDSPATFVAQAGTAGAYGTFAIDAAGAWTYTASSAHDEFADGMVYTDTFTVASSDGTDDLGDDPHHRHQRCGGPVGGRAQPDRDQFGDRHLARPATLTISDVDSPASSRPGRHGGNLRDFHDRCGGAWTYIGFGSERVQGGGPTPIRLRSCRGWNHDVGYHPHHRNQRCCDLVGGHSQPD